jgi:MerR family transcriptional regulator, thiopeptide resistance regulator
MDYYSTGEVAKKLNMTVRTLRYYDQIDLATPSIKKDNGTRYYNNDDLLHIEKITILKNLNLPLQDIKQILSNVTIDQLLLAHKKSLQEKTKGLEKSIIHTNELLNIWQAEGNLDWEQLIPLIRNEKEETEKQWADYFNEEEQEILLEKLPKMGQDSTVIKKWINIVRRIEQCLYAQTSPDSIDGRIIAEDVLLLSEGLFGDNKELGEKFWNIRKSEEKSTLLNLYPIKQEVLQFLEDATIRFTSNE